MLFLRLLAAFCRSMTDFGFKMTSQIDHTSTKNWLKKGCWNWYPTLYKNHWNLMPQTLENQAKPLYCRQFSWFPHMYTRCENRVEKSLKIEAKTTPNPLKNDTNFEPKKNAIKNNTKTKLKRQCAEKCSKRVSKKRPKSGASNFKLTSLSNETLDYEKHPRKTQCFRQKKLLFRRWSPIGSKWSPKDVKMVPMWVKMVPMGVKFVSLWSQFFWKLSGIPFCFSLQWERQLNIYKKTSGRFQNWRAFRFVFDCIL